jgi:hypothetical protein
MTQSRGTRLKVLKVDMAKRHCIAIPSWYKAETSNSSKLFHDSPIIPNSCNSNVKYNTDC